MNVGENKQAGRLPPWIRVRLRPSDDLAAVERLLRDGRLNTVCDSAHCPNRSECFGRGTATFMILGDQCTRACRFCAVAAGRPGPPDPGEPDRVAAAAARMNLKHVVITSVTRDDLPDGGSGAFASVIRALRGALPAATVEVLIPDFQGALAALETVLAAGPDVLNHNLETVRRLQAVIRPQAEYARSLAVLRRTADRATAGKPWVKSGLMAGLGETDDEMDEAMADLRAAGCEFLTIGQYLRPSAEHAPVARYVTPAQFEVWGQKALTLGFRGVASGPLVRSSYWAERLVERAEQGGKAEP